MAMIPTSLDDLEQKVRTMVTEQAILRLEISQLTSAITHLEQRLAEHPISSNPGDNDTTQYHCAVAPTSEL